MRVEYNPQKNIFVSAEHDVLLPQIVWHVTDKCNLNCKICFAKECPFNNHDLGIANIEKNLELLKQLETKKIDISGGEPLLFENLPFLVEQAKKKELYLTITTRGIGLKKNVQWLTVNWCSFSRIIVSIDGYDSNTCDYLSEYVGTYDSTITFLKKLNIGYCNNIRINTVVNRMLLSDDCIDKLCNLIERLQPFEWCLIQPHPINKRVRYDNYAVTEDEFNSFIEKVVFLMKKTKIKILFRSNFQYSTYWCLYSDDTIARLSDQTGYSFMCKLNESNMEYIKQNILFLSQILPNQ